jgi:hypothetical protein
VDDADDVCDDKDDDGTEGDGGSIGVADVPKRLEAIRLPSSVVLMSGGVMDSLG